MARFAWLLPLACACTTVVRGAAPLPERELAPVAQRMRGEDVDVLLRSGKVFLAPNARLTTDALLFNDGRDRVALAQVERASRVSHGQGAFDGALLGLLAGGAAGYTIPVGVTHATGLSVVGELVLFTAAGLFGGIITGAVLGHEYAVEPLPPGP